MDNLNRLIKVKGNVIDASAAFAMKRWEILAPLFAAVDVWERELEEQFKLSNWDMNYDRDDETLYLDYIYVPKIPIEEIKFELSLPFPPEGEQEDI